MLKKQLDFLDMFVQAVREGAMTDAGIAARASLYAGATRGTYYATRWGDWDLEWTPGDGSTPCLGSCRCTQDVEDTGDGTGRMIWRLGGAEAHCMICPTRAAASPHTVQRRRG